MPSSPADRPPTAPTLWLARGHQPGPDAPGTVRRTLRALAERGVIDGHLEPPGTGGDGAHVFEARWRVAGEVTVRARLSLDGGAWTLAAEAERAWDPRWPSPATMFWPADADAEWDREADTGLRLRDINPLPSDEKDLRRVLKGAARATWTVHVVVHEAMTPDARGRRPLAALLPPGLAHRVVEHRAAPQQLRSVNWALRDRGVEVPRGGAAVLPGDPAPDGWSAERFSVRTVFLDGSEPTELLDAVGRFAALPRPLPEGADAAVTALREDWHLLTLEEELDRQRQLVTMYAEALEAMTRSRDLYREAAERAHEALAAYRDAPAPGPERTGAASRGPSPFQQLTRTLERLKGGSRPPRPVRHTDTEPASERPQEQ
ncbi:hypothetical protein [Streptomyces flavalbus]|uniref:PE-PGRS family protein n=1 Tax=Streptomyces flavalbus TaxID=2665155 RepID=A0ABW2WJ90_9ACTN